MELFKGQIKDFNITQIPSNDGKNFPTLHKVIHRVKSWIRGIYYWVSDFNKLMKRIVERSPVFQSQLVCS